MQAAVVEATAACAAGEMAVVASFAAVEAVAAAVAESVVAAPAGALIVGMAEPVCLPDFAVSRTAVGPRERMSLAVLALDSEVQGVDGSVVARVGAGVAARVGSRKTGEESDSETLEERALLPFFHLDRSVGLMQRR